MPRKKRLPDELGLIREVGGRITEVRERERLSQAAFVEKLGKGTQRALANYERGEVLPPLDLIHRMCREFNLNFEWLMTGRGQMRQSDLLRSHSFGRSEEDAERILGGVQDVVHRYAYFNWAPPDNLKLDPLSQALRLSLSHFEREFSRQKGPIQFLAFLESLIHTVNELMGHELNALHRAEVEAKRKTEKMMLEAVHARGNLVAAAGKSRRKVPRGKASGNKSL